MNQHTSSLIKACTLLQVEYTHVKDIEVFLAVMIHGRPYYFIANEMPFNNSMVTRIVDDKSFTQDILSPDIRMPETLSFLDPDCEEHYKKLVKFPTHESISQKIIETFSFPLIIKMNSGAQGDNVYVCQNKTEVLSAIQKIFDKTTQLYDHILLAQEKISIHREFRVTVFDKEIVLIYEKDNSHARFSGNLSPLHWDGAKTVMIDDAGLKQRIESFIRPIFSKLDLQYGGLDIALDDQDKLCLFEINRKPAYAYLMNDYGDTPMVELYTKMLKYLMNYKEVPQNIL